MVNRKGTTKTAHRRANQRFLIECACGNRFWRAAPCTPRLRPYDCPKGRNSTVRHDTRCTSTLDQMLYVSAQRMRQEGS